jgi:hypothetical protein
MKKITLQLFSVVLLMAGTTLFGQATGPSTSTEELPTGIQDRNEVQNPEGAELFTVLITGAPGTAAWIDDVEMKIEGEGFVDADTFLIGAGTPTLAELQSYDAVFVFTDAGAADPVAFGDNLAAYLEGGGAVVDATFTPNVPITGDWTQYEVYSNSGQSNGPNLGIGTIADPADPLLTDVATFDGGTASFHNTGGTIANGAVVVAEYTTGAPLIIKQENVGPANTRRVFLNFYPPSIDARDDFWNDTSDGATIMSNAIRWVVAGDALSVADNVLTDVSLYPNPANNQITIATSGNNTITKMSIVDIMGRVILQEDVNATSKAVNVSSLTSGVYFARIEQGNATGSIKFIKQ